MAKSTILLFIFCLLSVVLAQSQGNICFDFFAFSPDVKVNSSLQFLSIIQKRNITLNPMRKCMRVTRTMYLMIRPDTRIGTQLPFFSRSTAMSPLLVGVAPFHT
ncbi:hypothetical protein BX666DRAFT_1994177 [Dichotomocladium elegans]|nr:hypothetical protein BX666DRAFT_1994177 [Dichotomocladium elegans]